MWVTAINHKHITCICCTGRVATIITVTKPHVYVNICWPFHFRNTFYHNFKSLDSNSMSIKCVILTSWQNQTFTATGYTHRDIKQTVLDRQFSKSAYSSPIIPYYLVFGRTMNKMSAVQQKNINHKKRIYITFLSTLSSAFQPTAQITIWSWHDTGKFVLTEESITW